MSLTPEKAGEMGRKARAAETPQVRSARARRAALARTTLDAHVQKIVESGPTLTPEQLDRLRFLLSTESSLVSHTSPLRPR